LLDSLLQEIEVHFSSTMESCAKCFMCQTELVENEFEIHIREYHRIVSDVDLIIKLQRQCEIRKSLVLTPPESPILTSTEVEAIKTPPKGIVNPADVYEAFGMPVSPEYTISACIESTPVCDKVKSRVSSVIKPDVSEMVPSSLVEDIMEGKSLTVEELVPKEAQAEVKLRSKSSTVDQRARRGSTEMSKTRKRKSLVICQNVNAVSNKIQFWKGKENVSKSVDSKIHISGNSVTTALIPKREKKSETLVNELLKQTLVEHLNGQKSADDTILVFDEIFAKNCPSIMDEAVEDNFNLLLDEPSDSVNVNTEDQCSEIVQSTHLNEDLPEEEPSYEDVFFGVNEADDAGSTNQSSIENGDEGIAEVKPDQIADEILADDEIVGNVANNDSVEIPNDTEKLEESNPDLNLSNFGTPTEKVDGKYRCSSCSKDFKFLTYLKAHQNSKSGCVSSAGKRRPSMNFSKIHYNDH